MRQLVVPYSTLVVPLDVMLLAMMDFVSTGPLVSPLRAELQNQMAQTLSVQGCDGTELLQVIASAQDPCPRSNQQTGMPIVRINGLEIS